MYAHVAFVLSLVASALATPYVTDPVSSTTCHAKQPCNIAWIDDGNSPSLKAFSPVTIGLYVGSTNMQVELQRIAENLDLSNTSSIQFNPDPTVGQSSDQYFIRILSQTLKDTNHTNAPLSIFSAKFPIQNMAGIFNTSVQQLIAGSASSLPVASVGGSSTAASRTASSTVSNSGTFSGTKATASSTASSSAGRNVVIGGTLASAAMVALFGVSF